MVILLTVSESATCCLCFLIGWNSSSGSSSLDASYSSSSELWNTLLGLLESFTYVWENIWKYNFMDMEPIDYGSKRWLLNAI